MAGGPSLLPRKVAGGVGGAAAGRLWPPTGLSRRSRGRKRLRVGVKGHRPPCVAGAVAGGYSATLEDK